MNSAPESAAMPAVVKERSVSNRPPPLKTWLGLNAFNLFMAGVQTGFGPFLPVYLGRAGWSQEAVGFTLSLGAIASVVAQVPAGFLVDHVRQKRVLCAVCLSALGIGALFVAFWPSLVSVWGAQVLHSFAAAVLTPGIAAMTLSLSGHGGFGERLGNNSRYASLGNAAAAALLGVVAYQLSDRAVFFVTAALTVPAFVALWTIRPDHVDPRTDHPALLPHHERPARPWHVFFELHLHSFAICVTLFTLTNAAMLPIALNNLARHSKAAGLATTGSIIALQAVVVLFAPWLGRAAQRWGRKPLLLVGFLALPLRGLLLATLPGPGFLIVIELLDGLSAAVIGVMIPLTAADLTRKTGYLNMAIGSFGLAASLGATFSTSLAGLIASRFGLTAAFLALSATGGVAFLAVLLLMPETRPHRLRPKARASASHPIRQG
jgi:predicted MFS family arabinose efflux permease